MIEHKNAEIKMRKSDKSELRVINTYQFGEISVENKHVFNFPNGILGFDDLREFVLISEKSTEPFKWLISLDQPFIGFPLLSPWHIDTGYDPGHEYDINRDAAFVVITLFGENRQMSANMKAPIIFNVRDQIGSQIILPSDRYSTNYVIPSKG